MATRRKGWRRVLLWTAASFAVLLTLLVGFVAAVLTIPTVRNGVLARVFSELESRMGLRIHADFHRLDSGGLELRAVDVNYPTGGYFVRVERLALTYRLDELLASVPTVTRVEIDHALLRLPASLFESSSEDDGSDTKLPPFRVEQVVLRDIDVRARYDSEDYALAAISIEGRAQSRPSLRVELGNAVLGLTSTRGALLSLNHGAGHYDDAATTRLRTDGRALGVPFSLDASLESVFDRIPDGALTLTVDGITGESLGRVGVDPTLLRTPVSLRVHAQTHQGRVSADVLAEARGAHVQVGGNYETGAIDATLTVAARSLAALSPLLPELDVAGTAAVRADVTKLPISGHIDAHSLRVSGTDLPDVALDAEVAYPELRALRLTSPAYGSHVVARGSYNVDTSRAHAAVSLTGLLLARLVPGSAGRIDGRAELNLAADQLRGAGSFSVFDARVGSASASQVSADASIVGPLSSPSMTASIRAPHVQAGPAHLESLLIDARGDGTRFDAVVDVRAERGRAALEVAFDTAGREQTLSARGEAHVGTRPLQVVADARLSASTIRADIGLTGPKEERLTARLDQGPTRLSAALETSRVDVGAYLTELGIEGIVGEAETQVSLTVPRTRGVMHTLQASLDGQLKVQGSAKNLGKFSPALEGVAADVDGKIRIDGSVEAPALTLDLSARAERHGAPSAGSDRLEVHASVDDHSAVDVRVFDAKGALFSLSTKSELGIAELREFVDSGQMIPPLDATLRLEQRRLDQQTGLIASYAQGYGLNLPVAASGTADLSARDETIKGVVDLDVTVFGSAIDHDCVAGADTRLQVHASADAGDLSLSVKSTGRSGGELEARATSHLSGDLTAPEVGPVALRVKASELWLPGLPGFCTLKDGRAGVDLSVDGLGSAALRGRAHADVTNLRAGQGAPIDADTELTLAPDSVTAKATLRTGKRQVGRAEVTLPLVGSPLPTGIDMQKKASASLTLEKLPIGALLAVGDALGQPSGTLDADLHVEGTLADPQPRGSLTLDDVSLSIAALAQPLQHINGSVSIEQRKLLLRGLRARDREGEVRVDGWASVDRALKAFADVRLTSEKFPLRRQGRIIGELSLATRFRVEGAPLRALDVKVDVAGGRLWLSDTGGGDVQSLSDHPDVHFADEVDSNPADTGPGFGPEVALSHLTVTTSKDLWVMHQDFSVQLGLALTVADTGEGPTLKGNAQIRRGSLMLLGRAFEIAKGNIAFTGDAPPNPELDLQATYEPPSGQKLVVNVTGRSSSPTVAFSGAATTAAEALAVVSGVGRANTGAGAEQKAQSDARGFATGLTAGLLSATVRRELGDWVPLISVENDAAGRVSSARAGVDASKIIPKFLRGFARGAYLEGVVGNDQTRASGRVGLGVKLELTLPRDFISSVGYGPGPSWATDLAWAP